jgi:UDP-N-acetylmuramate dehydrogenase
MTSERIPESIVGSKAVASITYYGIGGHAEHFAQPRSLRELIDCIEWAKAKQLPIALFGCGSNSLLADGPFNGLVLTLSQMTACYWETEDILYAEAGVSNTEIAEICLDAGRSGAAWMYRMPGHLGATVRMNARCYGGEISQICEEVFTLDLQGRLRVYRGTDVFYGYKKTLLMDTPEVVVAARLRLSESAEHASILNIMQSCEADRHRKHHFDLPSCGSTFKNNYQVGRPSGQVFDECGLKGARIGRSEVSQYHANFVWNLGGASARDMLSLAAHMRERALTMRHADLELEVQPVGLFDDPLFSACAMNKLGPSVSEGNSHWVGLLWHPASVQQKESLPEFPHSLLQSPFQHYFRTPLSGQPDVRVELTQLMSLSDAELQPDRPFLRWETITPSAEHTSRLFQVRPQSPVGFLDELWNYSVSELFVAHGNADNGEYYEFEMTPDGHWIAIAFDAPRKRKAEHTRPDKHHWNGISIKQGQTKFSAEFSYSLLKPLIHLGQLRIQACLSLGGEGWYLAPHWSPSGSPECWDTQHKPDVKPDFHQPQRFWRVALH